MQSTWVTVERTRAAVEELCSSEARYRAVFESMEEGLLVAEAIVDDGGRVVDLVFIAANPAAVRLTGVSRWAGRRLSAIDPSCEAHWLESWERVLRSGSGERVVLGLPRAGRSFECSLARVGGDGSPRVVAVFWDVSERRRTEARLHAAEQQKEAHLSKLAHDLRNPLTPIRTSVAILQARAGGDPFLARCHDVIDRQVTQMTAIIEELLEVSRRWRREREEELAGAEQPEPPPVAAARAEPRANDVPCGRVLVVDDNVDAADTITMLLDALGCEVRTVYDGEAAVQEAERFRPALVLLDLGMPGLDGYEVCRRIRSAPWGVSTFVAALSGWGQDDDRERSERAGFHRHLVKPIDLDVLLPVIRAAHAGGEPR